MKHFVVDTNVAIVANNRTPQASSSCVLVCIKKLKNIIESGSIAIDSGLLILEEYTHNLSRSGQPGVGDAFIKWVINNKYSEQHCEMVSITPESSRGFSEFPDDPALAHFDPSDRKFVAVALKSKNRPEILNAVDSDWWDYRRILVNHGVQISFLCPEQFDDSED